jgi:predicted nuclease with TOPRIM domain
MRERLDSRLAELKAQFEQGTERLDQLEEESRQLRETLLRISGAIQVLTEELDQDLPPPEAADTP